MNMLHVRNSGNFLLFYYHEISSLTQRSTCHSTWNVKTAQAIDLITSIGEIQGFFIQQPASKPVDITWKIDLTNMSK